ncbi:hypothetical protein dsx2_0586 [Desulfovibrio sp. X2]|uniref:DVU0298 family protein n=1 Tax=Desulfovibrio sp. X2 TaxID=941449 RepID=UPI0003587D5F|nr:DVU0298 family protein [Desulfovibrio sp. X2]EPR37654.1 hypothetical protein dsx2_0586 [Desulfovibrio sp. X2]
MRLRELRPHLLDLLRGPGWRQGLSGVLAMPAKALSGALFSLILHEDELVRFRAAEAFGVVLADLAGRDMEGARVVMRGMLWRMNEESGGIGWGVPEAMACAMAESPALAREYHAILLSYIHKHHGVCHGIFVDNPTLRRGVLWGIARLAEARPGLAVKAVPDLLEVLDPGQALEGREGTPESPECHDAFSRGLACLALARLAAAGTALPGRAMTSVAAWRGDAAELTVYQDDGLRRTTAGELAAEALARMEETMGEKASAPRF